MTAIDIRGLTKRYRDTVAVNDLSLSIEEGELFSLLGVNGAGKSTTIKMLSLLTPPTEGDAIVLGHSIKTDASGVKSVIALSPQGTAVAGGLTVYENLMLMAGACGMSPSLQRERVLQMLEDFSLTSVCDKRAGKLSGGWQRRLSIAMALICQPRVLFLDEPTLGLDVIARAELWDMIRSLRGRVTVILTTHYMEEAEALSDRVGIMAEGKLLLVGTPGELKARTGADRFEEAFIKIVKGDCL